MTINEIRGRLRRLDPAAYPELAGYTRQQIYDGKMGPGALYLAARMARTMQLREGQTMMDLGCGRGATSIFLARHYGVRVVAVDLWIGADELEKRFAAAGVADRVRPLNLDITGTLPFEAEQFDAIFCMDSVHYYGGGAGFFPHLLAHLKPGGRLCIGSPCFNREFTADELGNLPRVYDDGTNVWPAEFSKYHCPAWWARLLEATSLVEVCECGELDDGVAMWEDELAYNIDHQGWSEATANVDFAQIAHGYQHEPRLTHFVLTAKKYT